MTFVLEEDNTEEWKIIEIDHSTVIPNDGQTKPLIVFVKNRNPSNAIGKGFRLDFTRFVMDDDV